MRALPGTRCLQGAALGFAVASAASAGPVDLGPILDLAFLTQLDAPEFGIRMTEAASAIGAHGSLSAPEVQNRLFPEDPLYWFTRVTVAAGSSGVGPHPSAALNCVRFGREAFTPDPDALSNEQKMLIGTIGGVDPRDWPTNAVAETICGMIVRENDPAMLDAERALGLGWILDRMHDVDGLEEPSRFGPRVKAEFEMNVVATGYVQEGQTVLHYVNLWGTEDAPLVLHFRVYLLVGDDLRSS